MLPTLTAVLGSQPGIGEAPDPQPSLERERVLQGMARLIACFATPARPLVLLLDDLQWTDVGTLHVLERLLKQHAQSPVLFIGAFRGNEVGADHPLRVGPLAQWREGRDLVEIGAYRAGTNERLDRALALVPGIDAFLRQGVEERSSLQETLARLEALLAAPRAAAKPAGGKR